MKTKLFIVAVLFLALGQSVVTPAHAQAPPAKQPAKHPAKAHGATTPTADSNAAVAQTVVAQNAEPDVVRLSPKDLPPDPFRVTIQNSVQKGMQAAQLTVAVPHAAPIAASTGVPAGSQAAIVALQSAQSSVSSATGQKWGGHNKKAAGLISQALAACGQTNTKTRPAQAAAADASAAMLAAQQQLASAKSALAAATSACGGGRDQAISLITQAQSEVQASIDFAKSHQ